jgi:hypothetical protein
VTRRPGTPALWCNFVEVTSMSMSHVHGSEIAARLHRGERRVR